MSVEPLDVSSLEIIGYANVLPESALPSIVAPVFRRKDNPDSILVPPYSFNNGRYVCDATEISPLEFDSLESRSELTKLDAPLPAQKQHELWIDLDGQLRYQTRIDTKRQLEKIAKEALEKTFVEFSRGQFELAEHHSSIVLLADENNTEALAVKLAIARINGDHDSQETLRELVPVHTIHSINLRVDDLCTGLQNSKAPFVKVNDVHNQIFSFSSVDVLSLDAHPVVLQRQRLLPKLRPPQYSLRTIRLGPLRSDRRYGSRSPRSRWTSNSARRMMGRFALP